MKRNASEKSDIFPHSGDQQNKMRLIAALHAHGHIDPGTLHLFLAALALRHIQAMLDVLESPKKKTRRKLRRRG